MNQEQINFLKRRDYGEILGLSFTFFFKEIKKLYKPLSIYVLPFFIVAEFLTAYFNEPVDVFYQVEHGFSTHLFLINIINFLMYVMLYTVVSAYIKLYITKGNENFDENDVWKEVSANYGNVALAQILFGIIIVAGVFFLLIPGIYLAVVSIFVQFIVVFENKTAPKAIERSFVVIKNNWWNTFGMLIVVVIIFAAIIIVVTSVLSLISPATPTNDFSIISIFKVIFVGIISISVMTVFEIFIIMLYFRFVEEKEHSQLFQKISNITEEIKTEKEGISFDEINKHDEPIVTPGKDEQDDNEPKD
jgi:hypothetical protein